VVREVHPLTNLICLVTGEPIAIDVMALISRPPEPTSSAELLWLRDKPDARIDMPLGREEMLFTATESPVPLGAALARWFSVSAELESLLALFFATRRRIRLHEEHRLLNLTQMLEAFHRSRSNATRVEPAIHTERVERALAALAPKDRQWARYPLQHANDLSLAERLAALVESHPWLIGDVIKVTPSAYGEHVARTRNYHTHWDQGRASGAARGFDLWPMNEQLTLIAEASLLRELGFDDDAISESLRRASSAYRALKLNGW